MKITLTHTSDRQGTATVHQDSVLYMLSQRAEFIEDIWAIELLNIISADRDWYKYTADEHKILLEKTQYYLLNPNLEKDIVNVFTKSRPQWLEDDQFSVCGNLYNLLFGVSDVSTIIHVEPNIIVENLANISDISHIAVGHNGSICSLGGEHILKCPSSQISDYFPEGKCMISKYINAPDSITVGEFYFTILPGGNNKIYKIDRYTGGTTIINYYKNFVDHPNLRTFDHHEILALLEIQYRSGVFSMKFRGAEDIAMAELLINPTEALRVFMWLIESKK